MTFSKTSIYLFIFFFAAMAVSPDPAFARDPDKAVSKRDSDGDGKVSDSEWKGSSMAFERIDGNGDGYITAKEFADRRSRHLNLKAGGSHPAFIPEQKCCFEPTDLLADGCKIQVQITPVAGPRNHKNQTASPSAERSKLRQLRAPATNYPGIGTKAETGV